MEVAQVTDTEDDIREFARITPVDAAPEHKAAAGVAPAGRARHLPGNGHPLMPPWQVAESGPDEVTMQGHGNVLSEANGLMIKLLPHQP
jgi:hypothetical protein